MRTYIFLAIFWFLLAAVAFVAPLVDPDKKIMILDTGWSIGWLLLLFAVWNMFRWWASRPRVNREMDKVTPPSESNPKSS